MDPWFPDVHDATVGLLRRAGYEVRVPGAQTCCGALAAHDGHADEARAFASRNVAAFADVDLVVSDAAGCSAHLKEYGHWADDGDRVASKVRDVTEIVASLIAEGVLPRVDGPGDDVAVQDPCHLRHAQRIVDAPRAVVAAAGYRPVDIDPDGLCCGAAGVYSVLHPTTSSRLGEQKVAQIRGTGATIVASANPGCEMQLRSHLGDGFRVLHPIELYWRSIRESDRYASRRR
jgi:glycolate oxidase iron-sulfur subunit